MKKKIREKENFGNVWRVLLGFSGVLFLILGVVMYFIDNDFFLGSMYLLSAIIFYLGFYLISAKRIFIYNNQENLIFFNLGYVFSVIGLSVNIFLWVLGIVFFVTGIVRLYEEGKK